MINVCFTAQSYSVFPLTSILKWLQLQPGGQMEVSSGEGTFIPLPRGKPGSHADFIQTFANKFVD